jgi:peptidoglycan/LPS O-acetylase OafA/YrhL
MLALGAYAGLSFVLAIVSVFVDTKFAFYFPICRFWQMAIGGILAHLNLRIHDRLINNFLSTIAMIAILFTVFIMDDKSLFPGFWALIPTLSSAFIIQAKN